MTAVGDLFAEPACPSCGGIVVAAAVWIAMSDDELLAWSARLDIEQAKAEQLQPGDPCPPPPLCACAGFGPRAALAQTRGEA